jgi:hypothetical protein
MASPLVNFIGLGAQKCASTWIQNVIDEHPEACVSTPKELDYFSYFYGRGRPWYERHFAPRPGSRIVGDNSPSYLVHPLAPERAARYNGALKIVVALRDPVERAYSNHLHMIRSGFLAGAPTDFEQGLAGNEMYVEQSRYAKHLGHWLRSFPREQIHVVFQEDLVEGSERAARELYAFLGLDASFRPAAAGERANASRQPKHPGLTAAAKRGLGLLRRAGLGGLVDRAKRSEAVRALRRSTETDLRDVVPPMLDATRERLVAELQADMHELARLLGREHLPWPSFQPAAANTPRPSPRAAAVA